MSLRIVRYQPLRAITAAAFGFFAIAVCDSGWSGQFELISSLLLAAGGLITALIVAFRNRTWLPAGLNAAYWGTIFLVRWVNHY